MWLAGELAGAALMVVAAVASAPGADTSAEQPTTAWMTVVRAKADPGFWLLVRGARAGDPDRAADSLGTLAHVAVVDKEREEVVEAAPAGVRVTPVPALLATADRVQIVRPPGWTPDAGRAAVARARSRVGR